jgi:hypothetical protein
MFRYEAERLGHAPAAGAEMFTEIVENLVEKDAR